MKTRMAYVYNENHMQHTNEIPTIWGYGAPPFRLFDSQFVLLPIVPRGYETSDHSPAGLVKGKVQH